MDRSHQDGTSRVKHVYVSLLSSVILFCSALAVLTSLADKYKHFNDAAVGMLQIYSPSAIRKIFDYANTNCWVAYDSTGKSVFSYCGDPSQYTASPKPPRKVINGITIDQKVIKEIIEKNLSFSPICEPFKKPLRCRTHFPEDPAGAAFKFYDVIFYVIHVLFGSGYAFFALWAIGAIVLFSIFGEKSGFAALIFGLFLGIAIAIAFSWLLLFFVVLLGRFFGLLAWIGSTGVGALFILIGGLKKSLKELQDLHKQGRGIVKDNKTNGDGSKVNS